MKRFLILMGTFFCLFFPDKQAKTHPLDLIYKQSQSNEWDEDTRARYLILAVYNPESLPPELQDDRPSRLMTRARMELQKLYPRLSADNKALLAGYGVGGRRALADEPVLSGPQAAMVVGNFVVYYTTSGVDAVTNDYLNDVGTVLQQVEQVQNNTWGYPRPPAGPTGPYPVYISHNETAAQGLFGYMQPVSKVGNNPNSPQVEMDAYSSYLAIDNDFVGFGNDLPSTSLRTTLAHEYFHAVSLGMTFFDTYDPQGNRQDIHWMSEASATWMERVTFPEIDQAYGLYAKEAIRDARFGPFQVTSHGTHEYAGFLFFEYYHNRDSNAPALFRQILEDSSVAGGQTIGPMEHYKRKVEAAGLVGNMATLLGDYHWSLLFRTTHINQSTARYTYSMAKGFRNIANSDDLFNLQHTFNGSDKVFGSITVNGSGGSFSKIVVNSSAKLRFNSSSFVSAGSEFRVQWFKSNETLDIWLLNPENGIKGVWGEEFTFNNGSPKEFGLAPGTYFIRVTNPMYEPIPATSMKYTLSIFNLPPETHQGVLCVLKVTDPNFCPENSPDIKLLRSNYQVKMVWDPKGGVGLSHLNLKFNAPFHFFQSLSQCEAMSGASWENGELFFESHRISGNLQIAGLPNQPTELMRCSGENNTRVSNGLIKFTDDVNATIAYGPMSQVIQIKYLTSSIQFVSEICDIPSSDISIHLEPMIVDELAYCDFTVSLPNTFGSGNICGLNSETPIKVKYSRGDFQKTEYYDPNSLPLKLPVFFGSEFELSASILTKGGESPVYSAKCTVHDNHSTYPFIPYTTLFYPSFFVLADLNNDQKPDVVGKSSKFRKHIYEMLNLDGGKLKFLTSSPNGFEFDIGIANEDVNGDGIGDIVEVQSAAEINVFSGTASGILEKTITREFYNITQNYPANFDLADADNDGDMDMWVMVTSPSNKPSQYLGKNIGTEMFDMTPVAITNSMGSKALWADMNLDGQLDVVTNNFPSGFTIYLKNGLDYTPILFPTSIYFTQLGIADLNGDDLPDVFGGKDSLILLKNNFNSFEPEVVLNSKCTYKDHGDFDNDGDIDLVCTQVPLTFNQLPKILVYQNDGTGNFSESFIRNVQETETQFLRLADMDLDHDLDLVIGAPIAGVTWIKNNTATANSPPPRPVMQDVLRNTSNNTATFTWTPGGTDDHTPNSLISYHLRIGTYPGGDDVKTGYLPPGNSGNVGYTQSWTLQNAPAGTLFYSVRAIDSAYTPGPWSGEKNTGGFVLRCKLAGNGPEIPAGPRPNLADATALASMIAGTKNTTPCANRACDYDGNGSSTPTAADLAILVSWIVGDDPEGVCLTAARQAAGLK